MGTFDVVEAIGKFPLLSYIGAVDLIDRLNFIATVIMMILASLIVTFREYMMDPVTCYMATNPGGENLLKFMESYCWVEGTMSINDHYIPQDDASWEKYHTSRMVYYQWVPLMMFVQSAMFFLPHMLWVVICSHVVGINVNTLMQTEVSYVELDAPSLKENSTIIENNCDSENLKPQMYNNENHQTKNRYSSITIALLGMLVQHREWRHGKIHKVRKTIQSRIPIAPGKRLNNWAVFFYFIIKLLYFINAVGQLFLLQSFLQLDTKKFGTNFGATLLSNIIKGNNWEMTGVFPRVAYCMARVKHPTGRNTHVAQCVLTANLFIEKIYIFFWFWIVFLIVSIPISVAFWIKRLVKRKTELKKYLRLQGLETNKEEDLLDGFSNQFMRLDGVFLLQMLAINKGDVIVGPIVAELFKIWCKLRNSWKNKSSSEMNNESWRQDEEIYKLLNFS